MSSAARDVEVGIDEGWELALGHLIADVARVLRRAVDRRMRRKGITRAQWMILSRVAQQPGIVQKDLAAALELTKFAVTEPLRKLQEQGWIERRDDPTDGRAKRVFLTKAGESLVRFLREAQREVTRAHMRSIGERLGSEMTRALAAVREESARLENASRPPVGKDS
jgi:DNA-binding MarR family transcriptional regulator